MTGPLYDPQRWSFPAVLEAACPAIRGELLALAAEAFVDAPDSLTTVENGYDERGWLWCGLATAGGPAARLSDCPATAAALAAVPGLVNAGFSKFRPGTHLYPHRGELPGVLRCHLPLLVPKGRVGMRFGDVQCTWTSGRCLVFDDGFEHEAWNHGDGDRVILLVTFRKPAPPDPGSAPDL